MNFNLMRFPEPRFKLLSWDYLINPTLIIGWILYQILRVIWIGVIVYLLSTVGEYTVDWLIRTLRF